MYFYHDGENEVGPFGIDKLSKLAQSGLLKAGTLVREAENGSWVPFSQLALASDLAHSQGTGPKLTSGDYFTSPQSFVRMGSNGEDYPELSVESGMGYNNLGKAHS